MKDDDPDMKPVVVVTAPIAVPLASYPPSAAPSFLAVSGSEHIGSSAPAAASPSGQSGMPARFDLPAPQNIGEEVKLERTVRDDIERMKAAGIGME